MEAVAQRNARLPNATITNDINAKIGENIMSIKSLKGTNIETITVVELGRLLFTQRKAIGFSQGDVTKRLGYANLNFISMIEAGKSKIPINRVSDFVSVYGFSKDFALVILRVMHKDAFDAFLSLATEIPRVFKDALKSPDEEISEIYDKIRLSLDA